MLELFSINTIALTILGYPMSYLELAGTVFNLWCVWLVTRRKVLSWPVGLAGVVLFALLFWQIQLYADVLEQVYYFVTGVWGWVLWRRVSGGPDVTQVPIERLTTTERVRWLVGILVSALALGLLLTRVHIWLPSVFLEPASLPYLDALTTVMSFAAQILLMRRVVENWVLWIVVDVLAIGLYAVKGVMLVSVLYVVFLVLASKGLWDWVRVYRANVAITRSRFLPSQE
ncbi:MAG: nicotinamide mononucleotide transporter [Candidatus Pacebacteria bacterium]|nr:nicotinamide mononucleotide transporter [Candidatus Paceibacterota bacterium]